jgi:ribosome-binding factor A
MPREFTRGRRVEEQIQRIVSDLLRAEIRDPRLRQLIVTNVSVSRDLGVAWIHYTELTTGQDGAAPQGEGAPAGQSETAEALERARGFIRRRLAQELQVRAVPEVRFQPDLAHEQARRLDELIEQAGAAPRPGDEPGES